MSIRFNGSGDNLAATLLASLTIGTGDFSLGMWVKNISDRTTVEADFFLLGDAAASPTTYVYAYADFSGIFLFGGNNTGALATGTGLSVGTWYYLVLSRVSGVLHIRVFDDSASTTPVVDGTVADTVNYTTLDGVILGAAIASTRWPNAEAEAFKIHTGVSWSNAQARTESQFYAVQTAGGTNKLAWRLHTVAAGLTELGGNTSLTNTGCIDGASRPTQLEAAPSGGSAPIGAMARQPLRHQQRTRLTSDVRTAAAISGVAAITLGDVTPAATGALDLQASAAVTLGDVAPAATATLKLQAQSAPTLGDVTTAATAALVLQASAGVTLGDISPAATGAIDIAGTVGTTLGDVTLVATGGFVVPAAAAQFGIQPAFQWLNRSRLLSDVLVNPNLITATAALTLGDVAGSAQGAITIAASAGIALGNVTPSATGTLILRASSGVTVADVTPAATGAVKVQAGAAITLDHMTVAGSGVGVQSTAGDAAIALGHVTAAGTGGLRVAAAAGITLPGVTLVATASIGESTIGLVRASPASLTFAGQRLATLRIPGQRTVLLLITAAP